MEQTGRHWSSKVVYMTVTIHWNGAFTIASRERFSGMPAKLMPCA